MMKLNSVALLIFSLSFASYAHAEEAMDPEQLFKEAMELKDNGSILGAIEIFETIVSQQPGLNRARLELATAYHQARRYEEARKQLTQVLNDPETPETVKLTITGYLAQLSSDEKTASNRTSSSVYVSAGAFNDSNVNLGPNSELPGTTLEKTGSGVIGMASYSHVSLASKPFHTENSLIDFAWNSQISAYAKSYTSDSDSDFNLQVVSLSTGPALISNSNWSFQFNIKADKVYFGGDSYSFNLGINPKLILHFNNDLQFEIESLSTVREFSFVTDQGLDGISKM